MESVTAAGAVTDRTTYDDNTALPMARYSFGRLLATYDYYADGTLYRAFDPLGRATTFADYERGIAKTITRRDGTLERATVSNLGKVLSHTDAAGFNTQYGYDKMGRLARIDYPGEGVDQQLPTLLSYQQELAPVYGLPAGHWLQVGCVQPALAMQFGQIDQQGIAGEGRVAHVGRVARADAGQRQHLPQPLAGADQPIDVVVGLATEVAAAVRAGQGRGMQQHAAGSGEAHRRCSLTQSVR